MPGWGKLVTGAVLGAAGVLYATNEEFRKALPGRARELPMEIGRRFSAARAAAREASERRRAEILRELESHGGGNAALPDAPPPPEAVDVPEEVRDDEAVPRPVVVEDEVAARPRTTRPLEGLRGMEEG